MQEPKLGGTERDLHAFPDHQVMAKCLPGIRETRIDKTAALDLIVGDRGWLPVAVEPSDGLIYFVNIGDRRLSKWQFVYSIEELSQELELRRFSTDLGILADLPSQADSTIGRAHVA